jgi:hypothetical protein
MPDEYEHRHEKGDGNGCGELQDICDQVIWIVWPNATVVLESAAHLFKPGVGETVQGAPFLCYPLEKAIFPGFVCLIEQLRHIPEAWERLSALLIDRFYLIVSRAFYYPQTSEGSLYELVPVVRTVFVFSLSGSSCFCFRLPVFLAGG